MEALSPSHKSKINLRKHLHVSQVQSQSQPNSPKEAHSFHERKLIQPNRISLLSGTARTANPTASMDRITPFNKENALNKVSDFYNKSQIKDAIYSIDTLRDRIKFVDSILKRRVEIKEMEDQARFERASPTIAKAGQKLKSRVLARTQNKSRRSFILESLKGLSPSHSLASSLVRSEAVSRASPNHINLESSTISPVHGSHREFSFTNSVLSRVGEARISARIESPNSVRKEPINEELEVKRSNLSPSVSTNQIKRTSNILSLLAHNIQEAEEPASCLVFDNDENKASTKDSSIDFRVKGSRRSIIKGETHRSKAGSLTRDIYNLGGKDLEEDLYKYMVKHDKRHDASQIVANNNDIKEPLMRDIEAKAKTKFITFLDKQKQTNYMLPNSFAVRSHKEGKSLTGPRKYVSFDKNLELHSSKDKQIIKRNGSSSLVRRIKQEVFHEPKTTPNSPKEPALDVNNESFASVTEAKLDKLYRKSYSINKTLSLINSQIYDLTDREQFHKWDEYKQKKEKVLKENTKETMRQIHKKNFRKEF